MGTPAMFESREDVQFAPGALIRVVSRVIRPSLAVQPAPSNQSVATELKLESPAMSVMAVTGVRKRPLALIPQVIAESTSDVADQEADYRDMLTFVG
jgi:hypothetical protein